MGLFDPINDLLRPITDVVEQIIDFIKDISVLLYNDVKFFIKLVPSVIDLLNIVKDVLLQLLALFNKYYGVILASGLLLPLYVGMYYLGTTINILI